MTTLFELAARLQAANAAEGLLLMLVKATLILAIARLLLPAIPRASAATKHPVATAALIAVARCRSFHPRLPRGRSRPDAAARPGPPPPPGDCARRGAPGDTAVPSPAERAHRHPRQRRRSPAAIAVAGPRRSAADP